MRDFLSNRRGSVLLETALALPVLALVLLCLAEFGEAFTIKRRNAQVASTAADLVAQVTCVSASQTGTASSLQDIASIAATVLKPYSYSASIAGLSITSVMQNASNVTIQWSWAAGTLTAGTAGNTFSLPSGLASQGQTVIVAQTSYAFTPPGGNWPFLNSGVNFTAQAFSKPRTGTSVALQSSC